MEFNPDYDGELSVDFYGRIHPKNSKGTINLRNTTNLLQEVQPFIMPSFDQKTNHSLLFRRIGICAENIIQSSGAVQFDLFTDYEQQKKDRELQTAMQRVRNRYGANAIFSGNNLLEGATRLERNAQIGGHKA